jgi:hypothetical protein
VARLLLLVSLLLGYAAACIAQDATGLGGLPQGKGHAKMLSMSTLDVYASKVTPAGTLGGSSPPAPTDPLADALRLQAPAHSESHGRCDNSSSDFCYDAADRHIVYRPARMLMPTIHGMTAENISANRHGIRFKYSFP